MKRDLRTADPAGVYVPMVHRPNRPADWEVPLELVLACTSSVMKTVIMDRKSAHDWAHPTAKVWLSGKRFMAEVSFHGISRPALIVPMDVWAWDNAA